VGLQIPEQLVDPGALAIEAHGLLRVAKVSG
jgi:hypothetical protein